MNKVWSRDIHHLRHSKAQPRDGSWPFLFVPLLGGEKCHAHPDRCSRVRMWEMIKAQQLETIDSISTFTSMLVLVDVPSSHVSSLSWKFPLVRSSYVLTGLFSTDSYVITRHWVGGTCFHWLAPHSQNYRLARNFWRRRTACLPPPLPPCCCKIAEYYQQVAYTRHEPQQNWGKSGAGTY